jgi:hypothetical protein
MGVPLRGRAESCEKSPRDQLLPHSPLFTVGRGCTGERIELNMRLVVALICVLSTRSAYATLIIEINTVDGLVICADNRVQTGDLVTDSHHKLMVSKNGIVMTMSGNSTVRVKRPQDADYKEIYSFYDETIEYLNRYDTAEQVDWQGLSEFLQNGFLNKVIGVIGVPPWLRAFDVDLPKEKLKAIDTLNFFYVGKKDQYFYNGAVVDYRETNEGGRITASVSLPIEEHQARSLISPFGRSEIFQSMFKEGEQASELADKQQTLRDMIAHSKQTKTTGLGYLTDADHAIEASRYIIYITSTLGPNLIVSPTCDCGLLKPSGRFDLKSSLEPMTPARLKFTTKITDGH